MKLKLPMNIDDPYLKEFGEHFCIAPWAGLYSNGFDHSQPCCVFNEPLTGVNGLTPNEIVNSKEFKALRKNMLKGDIHPSCERACFSPERLGITSHRNRLNHLVAGELPLVLETKDDGTITPRFRYCDIRFSNLCNFKCHFCSFENSSSWFDEKKLIESNVKYFNPNSLSWEPTDKKVWKTSLPIDSILEEVVPNVSHINISGGEPLLIEENYQILERLRELKRFDVSISVSTKLSRLSLNNYDFLSLIKDFKDVAFSASIDAIGARAEYIRSGTNWQQIETNWFKLKDYQSQMNPNLNLQVFQSVFILNSFHAIDTYKYLEQKWKPDNIIINHCFSPDFFTLKSSSQELLKDLYEYYDANAGESLIPIKNQIAQILNDGDYDLKLFKELFETVNFLDTQRKTDFLKVFPEFEKYWTIGKR